MAQVKITSNFATLNKDLEKLGTGFKALGTDAGAEVVKLSAAMQQLTKNMAEMQKMIVAGKNVDQLSKAYKDLTKTVEDAGTAYAKVALNPNKYNMAKEVRDTRQEIEKAVAATSNFGTAAEKQQSKLSSLVSTMARYRTAIGLVSFVTTAIVGALTVALRRFADFEFQMARVQAVSRATYEEMRQLSEVAKHLGATTLYSAAQVGKAMQFLAVAGYNVKEIMSSVASVLHLATIEGVTTEEATRILTGSLRAFNMDASESARVANVLVATSTRTNTTLQELGFSLAYSATVAKQAGISFEELAAITGIVSNANIRGTVSGTAFRRVLTSILDVTSRSRKAFVDYKIHQKEVITAFDEQGRLTSFAALLRDIQGMDISTLTRVFQVRAVPAMAFLQSLPVDEIERFTRELEKSGGAAQTAANIVQNTLAGSYTTAKNALNAMLVQMATGEGIFRDFLLKFAEMMESFRTGEGLPYPLRVMIEAYNASITDVDRMRSAMSAIRLTAPGAGSMIPADTIQQLKTLKESAAGMFGTDLDARQLFAELSTLIKLYEDRNAVLEAGTAAQKANLDVARDAAIESVFAESRMAAFTNKAREMIATANRLSAATGVEASAIARYMAELYKATYEAGEYDSQMAAITKTTSNATAQLRLLAVAALKFTSGITFDIQALKEGTTLTEALTSDISLKQFEQLLAVELLISAAGRKRSEDNRKSAEEYARLLEQKNDAIRQAMLFIEGQTDSTRELAEIEGDLSAQMRRAISETSAYNSMADSSKKELEAYKNVMAEVEGRVRNLNAEKQRAISIEKGYVDALEKADEVLGRGAIGRMTAGERATFLEGKRGAVEKLRGAAPEWKDKAEYSKELAGTAEQYSKALTGVHEAENAELAKFKESEAVKLAALGEMRDQFQMLFSEVILGSQNMEEAFKNALASMAEHLVQTVTKMLADAVLLFALKAVFGPEKMALSAGAFGLEGMAKFLGLMHSGGPVGYASGGNVVPGGDTQLIGARRGEYVLNERTTRRIGVSTLNRINSGGVVRGGDGVNMPININALFTTDEMAEKLFTESKKVARRHLKPIVMEILSGAR